MVDSVNQISYKRLPGIVNGGVNHKYLYCPTCKKLEQTNQYGIVKSGEGGFFGGKSQGLFIVYG